MDWSDGAALNTGSTSKNASSVYTRPQCHRGVRSGTDVIQPPLHDLGLGHHHKRGRHICPYSANTLYSACSARSS